jgi:hypothetical protein
MKEKINNIIFQLADIRMSLVESIEEIIYVDMGSPVPTKVGEVRDLTLVEIDQLNKLRKDIHTLDEVVHYLSIMKD